MMKSTSNFREHKKMAKVSSRRGADDDDDDGGSLA